MKKLLSVYASSSGGCAAKIGPGQLARILAGVDTNKRAGNLLTGYREDAGAIEIGSQYLVQSIDAIAPVTDDAYVFGGIAAAHGLSDLYAKGAEPLSGLVLMALPSMMVTDETASAILQGVVDKLTEAGAAILGGHTIGASELLIGVAVSGFAQSIIPNNSIHEGDVLVLTKPLGVGIITTAARLVAGGEDIKSFTSQLQQDAEQNMLRLNAVASRLLRSANVNACTDVSGFGLIGHLTEMAPRNRIVLFSDSIPVISGTLDLTTDGVSSGGGERNWAEWTDYCHLQSTHARTIAPLLYDPQTSGGLLASARPEIANSLIDRLHEAGIDAYVVGSVGESVDKVTIFVE